MMHPRLFKNPPKQEGRSGCELNINDLLNTKLKHGYTLFICDCLHGLVPAVVVVVVVVDNTCRHNQAQLADQQANHNPTLSNQLHLRDALHAMRSFASASLQ
jgi:hypothetical protein